MGQIQAEPLNLNVSLCNGWRQDRITADVDVFDPPGHPRLTDKLKADKLDTYQVGAKARFGNCDYRVRAEAFWGWGTSGHYVDKTKHNEILPGYCFPPSTTTANIHNTSTQDFTIGAGYLFTLGQFLEITPLAGLSYHSQRMKIHKAQKDGKCFDELDGVRYRNQWQGPWLGADAALYFCDFVVQGGYEYHWADWNGRWKLHTPNIPGVAFTDKRKSHDVRGQVAYIDIRWSFCPCWEAGIGVKAGTWTAKKGKLRPASIRVCDDNSSYYGSEPESRYCDRSGSGSSSSECSKISQSFGDVGFPKTEVDKVKSAKWDSIRVTFDIGCMF
jgi:hypothetical protein